MSLLYSEFNGQNLNLPYQSSKKSKRLVEFCVAVSNEIKEISGTSNVLWSSSSIQTVEVIWKNYSGIYVDVSKTPDAIGKGIKEIEILFFQRENKTIMTFILSFQWDLVYYNPKNSLNTLWIRIL